MIIEAAFSNCKHFQACSNATAANIVGHLNNKTKNCSYKLDKENIT